MPNLPLQIPDLVTAVRLLLVLPLWVLALHGDATAVGVGLALCGLTDWLDGVLARRLNQTSAAGARFDSLADQSLLLSTIAWVFLLRPALFAEHRVATAAALAVYLLSLSVGLIKFRRLANLHLTLSRVAAYALYALLIHTFLAPRISQPLFWLTWTLFTLSSLETLVLQLVAPRVDEHMKSLWVVWSHHRNRPRDHGLRRAL